MECVSIFFCSAVPAHIYALISGDSLLMQMAMDHSLVERYVVQFWAECLQMFSSAEFAIQNLKLVRNVLDPVSEGAKKLIIHLSLSQNFYEFFIGQIVENRILHRLYLIERSFPHNEIQIDQQRVLPFLHHNSIHYQLLQLEVGSFVDDSENTILEDDKVIVIIDVLDYFFRMADPHLYFLGQVVESLVDKRSKKLYIFEDIFVGLF